MRTAMTIGMSTGCEYCRTRMTARTARMVSPRLRTVTDGPSSSMETASAGSEASFLDGVAGCLRDSSASAPWRLRVRSSFTGSATSELYCLGPGRARRCYLSHPPARHGRGAALHHEHGIAVTVEPIPLRDGFPIRAQNPAPPAECRDPHQQRRPRQMEVGQQAVDRLEVE